MGTKCLLWPLILFSYLFLFQGCQTQGPLSELEKSIDVIIDVFHQYSRREGDKDTLTRKELKLLIEKQLVNYLKVSGAEAGLLLPRVGRKLGWTPLPHWSLPAQMPPGTRFIPTAPFCSLPLPQHLLPRPFPSTCHFSTCSMRCHKDRRKPTKAQVYPQLNIYPH